MSLLLQAESKETSTHPITAAAAMAIFHFVSSDMLRGSSLPQLRNVLVSHHHLRKKDENIHFLMEEMRSEDLLSNVRPMSHI